MALMIGLLFVGSAINVGRAAAATFTQETGLTASGGAANNELGYSSAISGGTVVVGAPYANSNKGAVYVYTEPAGGWGSSTPVQSELTTSDGTSGDAFGTSVAIQGTTIVVGAPSATVDGHAQQGAVYVFQQSGGAWTSTDTPNAKLSSSTGAAGDLFGTSVAINGSTIAVGAPGAAQVSEIDQDQNDWCNATAPGAAYVFVGPGAVWSSTGTPSAKLTGAPSADVNLGTSVAVSGDTVAAGAPCATVDGIPAAGEVGLFVEPTSGWASESQDTWLVTAPETLPTVGPSPARGDELGTGVAMSGDEILAGAPQYINDGKTGAQATTSYLFFRPDGEPPFAADTLPSTELTPPDGVDEDRNGASVAMDGGVLVMGGPTDGGFSGDQAAYTESGGTWTGAASNEMTVAPGYSGDDYFYGASSGVSGQTIVGGAPGYEVGGNSDQGEAFIYQAPGPTATTASASSVGQTAALLNGVVNPEGDSTSCRFDWGRTTAYGNSVPCSPSPGSGTSAVAVSAAIVELAPGGTYHFQVVTSNSAGADVGADQQFTTATAPAPTATAPVNFLPPRISGTAKEGHTVTDVHGIWTVNPTSYSYSWERCNKSGEACAAISGATSQSYSITFLDVGHTLRVQETATANGLRSAPATSAASATVALVNPPPPTLKTVDVIPQKGKILVKLSGQTALHQLVTGKKVKIGSLVDVTKGSVLKITVASLIKKVKQSATVTQGEFKIEQAVVKDQIEKGQKQVQTTFALTKKEVTVTNKLTANKLTAQVKGEFRAITNALAATIVNAAKVVTEIKSTGTLAKVQSGVATVKDLITGATKKLSAGASIFAKLAKTV